MQKLLLVASLAALVVASSTLSAPFPAGSCASPFLDDGVRHRAAPASASQTDPQVVSMDVPSDTGGPVSSNGEIVVDLRFLIQSDGRVASPRVLCAQPQASPLGNDLLAVTRNWRFIPMKVDGRAVDSEASYRIVVANFPPAVSRLPLGFSPRN